MIIYKVPEQNLPWLREKVEKLNKKAEKLGVQPITIRTIGESLKDIPARFIPSSAGGRMRPQQTLRVLEVEVEGSAPVLAGWKFIATVEHVNDGAESGAVFHAVPGEVVPVQFRNTDGTWCDHCRTRRARNDTFIVQDVQEGHATDIYKQVGRQCLKDFIGHPKPEMYADWATHLGLLDDLFRAAEHEYSGGSVETRIYRIEGWLQASACMIRTHGWVSGKAAREAYEQGKDLTSTRNMVLAYWMGEVDLTITEQDKKLAESALLWAREQLPQLVVAKPDNDYLYNLATVARLDAISIRMVGIATSLIPAYQREMQKNVSFEDRAARSNFVGQVGVRVEFTADVTAVRSIQYRDGTTGTVIEFTDDEGNELVWFTSGTGGFEIGKAYRVKATVKRHQEYRGIKQTAINRAQNMDAPKTGKKTKKACENHHVNGFGTCDNCGKDF